MREKVLLTGATGFLGFNIAKVLSEQNFRLTVSVRSQKNINFLEKLNCEILEGNLEDEDFVDQLVAGKDFVIHCASYTEQFDSKFENYQKANFLTTTRLVESSKKAKIKRFVLVSTANCFTCGTMEVPGSEDSGFMEFLKNSHYALSKFQAQDLILREFRENKFPAIVVAPTFLVGEYDRKPSSGKLMLYVLKNRILFYPSKGGKSFVDVSIAAKATVSALFKGNLGQTYLLAGENQSYKSYFKEVLSNSELESKKYFIPIPYVLIRVLMKILKIYPTKSSRLWISNLQLLFSENYFTNKKAMNELGMESTDLKKSIVNSLSWFRSQNYI